VPTGGAWAPQAFPERRGSKLAQDVAAQVVELEAAARATEVIPADVASVSGGLDRMSVRGMSRRTRSARLSPAARSRRVRPLQEAHWRKARAGSITLRGRDGKELGTRMYGAEANTDPNALADRVAADIAASIRA
jgi:hypothetical protein